jgi:sodium/hydrogen antiporter
MLEETTRLTLAVSLMGVAVRLPERFPLRGWRTPAVLLGLASSILAYLILPILAALVSAP